MNYGIILLGGDSTRTLTPIPKQFIPINNKEIFLYSFELFLKNKNINKIILVCSFLYKNFVEEKIKEYSLNKEVNVIVGGISRQDSSFLALNYIKNNSVITENINVIIHDAARPLLTSKILNNICDMLKEYKAISTYIPIYDSICSSKDENKIFSYKNRNETFLLQTPQAFNFDLIYKAHLNAIDNKLENINDDSLLVNKYGEEIYLNKGNLYNFKITTEEDLAILFSLVGEING
ncbi:MAG: IspD/TarI family cytidylyltransferase [Bacillales bacterium]